MIDHFGQDYGSLPCFASIPKVLQEGDEIAADRAFAYLKCIEEKFGIKFRTPANTNSPNTEESNETRRLCAVREVNERKNEEVKDFKLLE